MQVQNSQNNSTVPFILNGTTLYKDNETLLQDGGRSGDLVFGTLLAKILTGGNAGKWVPFTDETATDGSAIPVGIYVGGDIPEADIIAGDVAGLPILVGSNAIIDKSQLTIENSKTIDTVIATGTVNAQSVEEALANKGIYLSDTVAIDEFEN